MTSIVNKISLVQSRNLRFLVMDAPKDTNLDLYIEECKKHHVVHLVRISEPSYDKARVESQGIKLHVNFDLFFINRLCSPYTFLGNVL